MLSRSSTLSLAALASAALPLHEHGFNAGVFAYDLDKWRATNATDRLERSVFAAAEAIRRGEAAKWTRSSSQAPMVDVFCAGFRKLEDSWNTRLNNETSERAAARNSKS